MDPTAAILFWIVVGAIVGALIAQSRGRSGFEGVLLGGLLGIIGWLILVLLPAQDSDAPRDRAQRRQAVLKVVETAPGLTQQQIKNRAGLAKAEHVVAALVDLHRSGDVRWDETGGELTYGKNEVIPEVRVYPVHTSTGSEVSSGPALTPNSSAQDRLTELDQLKGAGLISDGEYQAKRQQILDEI